MAALRQAPTADKRGARTSSEQAGTAVCLPSCSTVGSSQGLPSLGPQVAHPPVLSFRWPLTCMTELMATSTAQYSAWPRASWFQMRTMAMQRASPTRMTPAAGCCCQCRLQWGMGLKMMHMLAWKRCQHKAAERNVSRQQNLGVNRWGLGATFRHLLFHASQGWQGCTALWLPRMAPEGDWSTEECRQVTPS